jgi:glutathione synthase/RimK-type ligase-like ATP-grasp enzyme
VVGAAAAEVCREKPATCAILTTHGICNIHHEKFLSPASELAGAFVSSEGVFNGIAEFCSKYGNRVVVKPLKGTGGLGLSKCETPKDVEAAVLQIFKSDKVCENIVMRINQ